jgi:hypothetical protein
MRGRPIPSLTKWQARRRKGAPLERVVMGLLFAALAVAMIVYFAAITRIIGSVFWP